MRVAIVGAGPSGFYAAEHILKDADTHAQVDLFDRLPTPFGLVRGGVAPDHPKIKSVIRVYEKTAAREGFRFFGNVKVGHDIEVEDLERLYHAIVFTVGCETDRRLGIPGEELPGSHAATSFVGWYNAHPDYCDEEFDLSGERAVVIGNGNVAMDVARMLALTDHELRQTDTADHAIELLDRKQIREIVVLGRRGPVQAAFTNPEIKELGEMEDADVIVDPAEVELDAGQRRLPRVRRGRQDDPGQRRDPARVLPARAGGQEAADRPALPRLAGRDQGRRQGRVDRRRPQRAGRGGRQPAGQGHGRARRARVRPGPALGRLHRHPDRGRPLRREARPDPQRGRPRARLARLRPQGRPLHRRLDQARALRRDRHQQERRAGDRPAPARRRRRRRPCSARRAPSPPRSRTCSPSAASATSASRTGRRSTRPRSAAASPTAAPASSSSASRRCSRRWARRSPAERRGRPRRAEVDDRGGAAGRRGRGGGRRRRRPAPAGDGGGAAVRGALAARPAPAGQGRGQGRASTTARSTPSRSRPRSRGS